MSELAAQYDMIKSEAQRDLGTLFNSDDYPGMLDGLFDVEDSCLTIEPPNYLTALLACPLRRGHFMAGIRHV